MFEENLTMIYIKPETQSVIYFDFFNKSSSDSDTDNNNLKYDLQKLPK